MAGLHFDITADNTNLIKKLKESERGIRETAKAVEQEGGSIESLFSRMSKAAAAFGTGFTAKELIQNIIQVRGEFQQLEVAFTTMLGSQEKATALMSQLTETAAKTPFDLQGVANGARQLLAYGTAMEDVNDTLVRLGNIAAGLSIPLNDLVYLYGTTMTQGRLYTQDLNQFTGRGIPMIRELAKEFGVAESEIKTMVEAGKIGFPEVQKVINNLTNEGGMFFNLMEEQSKTITGQISNIGDSFSMMLNDMGKASEGVINDALSSVSYLIENYEAVGRQILALVSAYGAYKAVLMSVAAYQNALTSVSYSNEIAQLSALIPQKEKSASADLEQAVASGRLTQAKAEQLATMRLEAASYVESLRLKAQEAATQYQEASAAAATAAANMEAAEAEVAAANIKYNAALRSANAKKIERAETELGIAESNRYSAAKALEAARTNATVAYTNSSAASKAAETAATTLNTAAQSANTKSTNLLTIAKTKLIAASKALGLSLLANPYVVAAAAVAALTYRLYTLITAETQAEKAVRKHREEQEKFEETINKRRQKIEELIRVVQDENETETAKIKAYDELAQLSPALADAYTREELATASLSEATKKLNEERDEMEYENVVNNVNKYSQALNRARSAAEELRKEAENETDPQRAAHLNYLASGWDTSAENAKRDLEQWQKHLDELNKVRDKANSETESDTFSTEGKSISQLEEEIEKAQKSLENLKKALADGSGTKEAVEQQEAYIKSLQDTVLEREKELKVISEVKNRISQLKKQQEETVYGSDEYNSLQSRIDALNRRLPNKSSRQTDKSYEKLKDAESSYGDELAQRIEDEEERIMQSILSMYEQWENGRSSMNRYLQDYGNFEQKRLAITEEYEEKIRKALSENNIGEALNLTHERNDLLSSLDPEASIEAIEKAFGDISNLGTDAIDQLIDNLKKYRKEAIDSFDVSDIDKYEEALSKLENAKLGNKFSVLSNFIPDFYKEEIKARDELNQAEETSLALSQKKAELEKQILDYIEQQTGEKANPEDLYSKTWLEKITGSLSGKGGNALEIFINMKASLDDISQSSDNAKSKVTNLLAMGKGGGAASTVAMIDTIVHGINDIVHGFAEMGNEIKSTMDALGKNTDIDTGIGKFTEGMNMFAEASQGATDAWDSLKSGNIGGVFAGVTKSFTAWIKGFAAIHDKKNEKQIQRLQEQVEALEKSYKKLGKEIEKAYSTDAAGLIEDQNKLLEQQKVLIQQQIAEEEDKKHTDNDRIEVWKQQLEGINETLEENKEKALEAITGTDVMSAIDEFAQAYADALANGEDAAKASTETVKKLIKTSLLEFLKKQLSPDVEEFMNKLGEYMSDGIISSWEQSQLDRLSAEMDKTAQNYYNQTEKYWKDEDSEQQQQSSKGYSITASQGSVDEMNGRLTAMYEVGLQMLSFLQSIQSVTVSVKEQNSILLEIKNIAISSNGHLQDISGFQKKIYDILRVDIPEIKQKLNSSL